ncbi:MAG: mandelate racemase/muconate lactonizing enzyme family protein, partial [Ilumatobacteraceae bacterium]
MSFFFVRVDTDAGVTGYGEACDSYGCSYGSVLATVVDDVLAPLLVGQPVTAVEPLADRMRLFTRRRLGDQWVAVHARSALELALWDVTGKAAGRSASSLAGSVRDRVEVYVSSVFLEEQPAEAHVQFLLPFLQRGVTKVKLRIGPEWQPDLSTLAEIRALLGPGVELMVDGSEIFTLPTAQTVATALHALDVRWFEEPLPQGNRSGIESLVRSSPVPIAYGEHLFGADEAIEAMRREQLHVLQPDASTCGGLAEARRMAQAAVPFGVRVVPHVCAGPVSLAANL